jgi:hypothetical protein
LRSSANSRLSSPDSRRSFGSSNSRRAMTKCAGRSRSRLERGLPDEDFFKRA